MENAGLVNILFVLVVGIVPVHAVVPIQVSIAAHAHK